MYKPSFHPFRYGVYAIQRIVRAGETKDPTAKIKNTRKADMGKDDKYSTTKSVVGKTIASFEMIRAEYGRTYDTYLLFTFTDGTKALMCGEDVTWNPNPSADEMKKAPNFFSAKDIANKVLEDELCRRSEQDREKERRLAEYKRLQAEFGNKNI